MKTFEGKRRLWFIPLVLVGLTLLIFVTMSLWNCLMPVLFHLPLVTFWQAAGLLVLFRLLSGFGGHHGGRYHRRNYMRDKWEKMSPEEREKFRNHLHAHRWCREEDPEEAKGV
jgi:Ca2+/H+ antiporter, TMEM165/GDT1 family